MSSFDNINILKMLYTSIKQLSYDRAYVLDNHNNAVVIDLDGNEIIKCPEIEMVAFGSFTVRILDKRKLEIVNHITKKSTTIRSNDNIKNIHHVADVHGTLNQIYALGEDYLAVSLLGFGLNFDIVVYNKDLDIIFKSHSQNRIKMYVYKETSTALFINCHILGREKHSAKINKLTSKFDYYDIEVMDNGATIISCEQEENKSNFFAIRSNSLPDLKYKILNNEKETKSYSEIVEYKEITDDVYYKAYNCISGKPKVGLIDKLGTEIIPVLYDEIIYIGCGSFILEYGQTRQIFNINRGSIVEPTEKNKIEIHSTLPFVMIKDSKEVYILDNYGRLFKAEEVSKYYKCSYNTNDSNVVKVDMQYNDFVTSKYIDRNFNPITNINFINKCNACGWIDI